MAAEPQFYRDLHAQGALSDESYQKVKHDYAHPLLSVHRELQALLYAGIVLLTTGLGVLVYKNIDTIGHQVILLLIAGVSAGCFAYCYKHKKPFSPAKVPTPNSLFDYILLLGTLCMLIFTGYLQFQYNVFGNRYGLATFIPMVVLFFIAYYFDHIGILTMAIVNLGVWMGVSVTPKQLLSSGNFNSEHIIYTYLLLGMLLLAAAYASQHFHFKSHFKFSYQHYGVHVTFITLLAGYFRHFDTWYSLLWFLGVMILAAMVIYDAYRHHQFYFILLGVLYGYIALSCLIVRMFDYNNVYIQSVVTLAYLYFVFSPIALIIFLIKLNKKLKTA